MASYRRDADANRNALFGSSSSSSSSRPTRRSNLDKSAPSSSSNAAVPSSSLSPSANSHTLLRSNAPPHRRTSPLANALTGQARIDKLQEAQEYQKKAKKALQKSLFSSPDPVSAALFYHRAAEAYKQCGGEDRLERLHRVASAECHVSHGAYAIAAGDFVRAAELLAKGEGGEETMTMEERRRECHNLYENASKAWREGGEMGRAAECLLQSGFALLVKGEEENEEDDGLMMLGGPRLMGMNRNALEAIEAAVENHVPDPLNRYKHFRQTGVSLFVSPEEAAVAASTKEDDHNNTNDIDDETRSMCLSHMVKSSFAHETVARAVEKFAEYGEYKSALYAAGAVTALLEQDGFSTISLSRAYCVESILSLAIGDVVAADKYFLEVHLQNNNYLTSRECKLAEDLIRAVKMRNEEDLEIARNPNGENRAALSNLNPTLRNVVATLRISGVAKSMASTTGKVGVVEAMVPQQVPNSTAHETADEKMRRTDENLDNELDDLMKDMGLASDNEQNDEDDDDDDIDLR